MYMIFLSPLLICDLDHRSLLFFGRILLKTFTMPRSSQGLNCKVQAEYRRGKIKIEVLVDHSTLTKIKYLSGEEYPSKWLGGVIEEAVDIIFEERS